LEVVVVPLLRAVEGGLQVQVPVAAVVPLKPGRV
jgi:hypothetical protein